jgi:chorismate mutase/prephenate dehydratase
MFNQYDAKIISEFTMRITHSLLSKEKSLSAVRKIYSHRQPIAQCRKWIEFNLPCAEVIETDSTAMAAKLVARTKGSAAIASEAAASLYGLRILKPQIQDLQDNFTRFLVIGRENDNSPTGHDKTSILFTCKDEPGALYAILSFFVKEQINLSKIESRPFRGRPWEYFFFVDIAGHEKDGRVRKVLDKIRTKTIDLKILGSYPENHGRTKR